MNGKEKHETMTLGCVFGVRCEVYAMDDLTIYLGTPSYALLLVYMFMISLMLHDPGYSSSPQSSAHHPP